MAPYSIKIRLATTLLSTLQKFVISGFELACWPVARFSSVNSRFDTKSTNVPDAVCENAVIAPVKTTARQAAIVKLNLCIAIFIHDSSNMIHVVLHVFIPLDKRDLFTNL